MKTTDSKAVSVAPVHTTSRTFFSKEAACGFFSENGNKENTFFKPSSAYSGSGNSIIQTKLTIGQPNDKYEKEADEMADKVVQRLADTSIQAKCTHCEEEEKKKTIQRKCAACAKEELHAKAASPSMPAASPQIESSLNASKGSGNPLPENTKAQFEDSFGADFSSVRLHTDTKAAEMSKDLNAQAFTHGSNIYFNNGKYNPDSSGGKHLLAHELTHVVQQGGSIKPKIQRLGDMTKVPPMPCEVVNSSPAGVVASTTLFAISNATLTADQKNDIVILVESWKASGARDALRVDGYASTSGSDEFNWKLSCDRAMAVANELQVNGVPNHLIEIFAQGETNEFGASANNQRADITLIAAPPPTKAVTINFTVLNGATDSSDRDIATSNAILVRNVCNLRIAKGNTSTLDAATTSSILGTDNLLEEPSGDTASAEERRLTAINRSSTTITAYYVPGFNPSKRGTSLQQPSHGVPDSLLMSSGAVVDTFTHELFHILTRGRGHSTDPDNLMASGNIRNVGVDNITGTQCNDATSRTVYPR